MSLGDEQIERYSRQILLPDVGARGQERLLASSAAVVGAGSLARLCVLYLAGAGVGRLGLAADSSEAPAVESLASDVTELNPEVRLELLRPSTSGTSRRSPFAAVSPCDVVIDTRSTAPAGFDLVELVAESGGTLFAAGTHDASGWLARQSETAGCVACVSLHERDGVARVFEAELAPSPAGVVASLLAFEAIAALLAWPEQRESWLHYDGLAATVESERLVAHAQCPDRARHEHS